MVNSQKSAAARELCACDIQEFDSLYSKLQNCQPIASLSRINNNLNRLTADASGSVSEIADVISRDLSLTTRLLRLVNSVFSGLSIRVTSIEEAIFYLGLKEIRQLAMTTQVIDDIQAMSGDAQVDLDINWIDFWRHSIGVAILSKELSTLASTASDTDEFYIAGLLKDIGKLLMYRDFPDELRLRVGLEAATREAFSQAEVACYGWHHAQLGALYLELNSMPESIVDAVLHQYAPERSQNGGSLAAVVQLADLIVRYGGCEAPFESVPATEYESWDQLPAWSTFFADNPLEINYARAHILGCIERLPAILNGLL
jgi:HD-like signal output (HDOD) protein